jgi:hypothetical protein
MKTDRGLSASPCFAALLWPVFVLAQIVAAQIQVGPTTPPAGLKVELRLGDGKRTAYHIGELVPFSLIFRATDHTKQWVSGETPCDSPTSYPTTIPPNTLLTRETKEVLGNTVCTGHGWGKEIDLAQTPWTQTLALNHQYSLDTPGSYEIVWSGEAFGQKLTSNLVRLELLPRDSAWEAKQLALADAALDMRGEHAQDACDMLGYLGTPAAELDIARRYNDDVRCPGFRVALINAKDRDAVLRILEAKIDASNEIIFPQYLRTLATLSLYRAHPEWYDIALHAREPVEYAHAALMEDETIRYVRRLVAALPSKQPYVRAQCIRELAAYHPMNMFSPRLPPDASAALRQQMPAVFRELSEYDQRSALRGTWSAISSPAMIPVLVAIIEKSPDTPQDFNSPRADALLRLFELDSNRARTFLMQAIVREPSRINPEVMAQLPEEQFPQLDQTMLQRVTDHPSNLQGFEARSAIRVLSRFASPAIEPQVRALLEVNFDRLDCDERFDLMAYLHRTNPSAADKFFARVHFGVQQPNCTLQHLASLYWSPAIESAELAQLDSSNPSDVQLALQVLEANASPAARPIILHHFQAWNATYSSKAKAGSLSQVPAEPGAQLERSYLYTLISAYGWISSREEIEEYGKLCLTSDCRNQAQSIALRPINEPIFIQIEPESSAPVSFSVGLCRSVGDMKRLKGKISQYPKGTAFRLDAHAHTAAAIDETVATLGPWITAHGYQLSLYREAVQ